MYVICVIYFFTFFFFATDSIIMKINISVPNLIGNYVSKTHYWYVKNSLLVNLLF